MKHLNSCKLMLLVWCIGVIIFSITYYLANKGNLFYSLFWIAIIFMFLPLLFILLKNSNKVMTIIILVLVALSMYSMQILRSPHFFIERDEMMHYQTAEKIIEQGNLKFVHTTLKPSTEYPGISLLNAQTTMITNADPFLSGRLIIAVIHSLILVTVFLIFRKNNFKANIAALGAFIYATNPRYSFFDTMVSYETMGLLLFFIFFQLLFYNISIYCKIMQLIILSALTITHHFSSFQVIILLLVFVVAGIFTDQRIDRKKINLALLAIVLILTWLFFLAINSTDYLYMAIKSKIIDFFSFVSGGTKERIILSGMPVPILEQIIDRYIYPPLLLLLGVMGFYKYVKYSRKKTIVFPVYGIMFLFTWPLIVATSTTAELGYRSWAFLFIGFVFLILMIYVNWEKIGKLSKYLLISCIIILLFSGISIGRNEALRFPVQKHYFDNESFATLELYESARWFKEVANGKNIIGNTFINDYFGSYMGQVVKADNWSIYIEPKISEWDEKIIPNFDYLISDYRMSYMSISSPSNYWFLGDVPQQYCKEKKRLIDIESLNKFNRMQNLELIYQNSNICIYHI